MIDVIDHRPKEILMRDLDMSDVLADARDQEQMFWDNLYMSSEQQSTEVLEHTRYRMRIMAHEGDNYAITSLRMIDDILLMRITTTICEGCRNRTGCDMCCPSYYEEINPYYDDQHFERFGRPEFPNEY